MAPPNDPVPLAALTRAPVAADPANRPDPAALQPSIGAMLHDVARLMRRRFERRARQTGLPVTRQQARALLHIARNEGLSQAAVATMLDIEPIALVRILDRLHEEGLVDRRPVEAGPRHFDQNVNTFYVSGGGDGHFDAGDQRFNWDATIAYGDNHADQRRSPASKWPSPPPET